MPDCASGAQISHRGLAAWDMSRRLVHQAHRSAIGNSRMAVTCAPCIKPPGNRWAASVLGRYVRPVHTTATAAWPQSGCLADTCARCTPRHPRGTPTAPTAQRQPQRRRADSTGADRTGVPWNDAATKHRVVSSRRRVSVRRRSFRETAQSRAGLSGSPPPVREPCRFRHGSLSLCRAPAPAP